MGRDEVVVAGVAEACPDQGAVFGSPSITDAVTGAVPTPNKPRISSWEVATLPKTSGIHAKGCGGSSNWQMI